MKFILIPAAAVAGAAAAHLALPVPAPASTVAAETAPPAAIDDARRASATRLLDASRFRARQEVLLGDSIAAGQADLLADCLDRAAEGRSLAGCDATRRPAAAMTPRMAAARPQMLDEIMVASQTVYARRFTASEMDEITRFFRTPVGQKYGAAYPQIIGEVQQRKHAIVRKYLIRAAQPGAKARP